ncbi:MAG: hypothetical protein CL525_14385 [Aequorivita sp.]|nr:hypothetical protein [Aequorivita sp.]
MEYDNTNKGAAFPPRPEQAMILTGKINLRGEDNPVVLVKDTDHTGKPIIGVYKRAGVLFPNDKKEEGDNQPEYKGPIEDMRMSAWKNISKDGMQFMSITAQEKMQQTAQAQPTQQQETEDVIPF